MVVCKFFMQGVCRYGSNCRFEHQLGSEKNGYQPFGNNQNIDKVINPITGAEIEVSSLINSVQNDVVFGEKGRQWLLTCYAPYKEKALYPGFVDMCFEEVRFEYIEAQKSNNLKQYNQRLQQILLEAQARYKSLQNPTKEIVQILKDIYTNQLNSTIPNNQNFSEKNMGFGTSSSSILGQTSQEKSSVFGQNSPSVFGQQNSMTGGTSIFGLNNGTQNNGNLFSQQNAASRTSIFGQQSSYPSTGSIFGQQQSTNNIFRQMNVQQNGNVFAQQQGSIFGQSGNALNQQQNGNSNFGQQSGSIFGQQSAQSSTNIFSNTNQSQSSGNIFAHQDQSQKTGSIFGQQNTIQTSGNIFGQQNTNSIFAQQSNISNTSNIFGQQNATQNTTNSFSNQNNVQSNTGIFGQQNNVQSNTSIFRQQNDPEHTSSIFGQQKLVQGGASIFGQHNMNQNSNNSSVFETKGQTDNAQQNSNSVFKTENKTPFNVPTQTSVFGNTTQHLNPSQCQSQNMVTQGSNQQQSSIFARNSEQTSFVNQNSNSVFQSTNSNLQQSPSIFGLTPNTNTASISQRPLNSEINHDAYSKLENLTEEEIKWFNSDVFDIYKIPEKPPTYEMCF